MRALAGKASMDLDAFLFRNFGRLKRTDEVFWEYNMMGAVWPMLLPRAVRRMEIPELRRRYF